MHKNRDVNNPTCQKCETFLPSLSFVMQDFYLWVIKSNSDMHICWGFRSQQDQHAAVLEQKSKLDWPNSAHNNLKDGQPFSEAIDLFVLSTTGEAEFPVSRYQDLNDQAIIASQPVLWGGSWAHFKDLDHYQNASWRSPGV